VPKLEASWSAAEIDGQRKIKHQKSTAKYSRKRQKQRERQSNVCIKLIVSRGMSVCIPDYKSSVTSILCLCRPPTESSVAIDVVCCECNGACRWQKQKTIRFVRKRHGSVNSSFCAIIQFTIFFGVVGLMTYDLYTDDDQTPSCIDPDPLTSTRTRTFLPAEDLARSVDGYRDGWKHTYSTSNLLK